MKNDYKTSLSSLSKNHFVNLVELKLGSKFKFKKKFIQETLFGCLLDATYDC